MSLYDCLGTANLLMSSLIAKDESNFQSECRALKIEQMKNGGGSWYVNKIHEACINHLETRANIIFEALERNLVGSGIYDPCLNEILRDFFDSAFRTQETGFERALKDAKGKDALYFKGSNLNEPICRILAEYYSRIETLCRRIEVEENKAKQQSMSINNQFNISGGANNFQIGDHNRQEIIQAISKLNEAIEASQASPEDKKEAKSRLRKFFDHQLIIKLLGTGIDVIGKAMS